MDENQQPSVTQELGRLFPSIRGRGRRGESSELLGVGAGESYASATDTNNNNNTVYHKTNDWRNMGVKSNIEETTEVYVA